MDAKLLLLHLLQAASALKPIKRNRGSNEVSLKQRNFQSGIGRGVVRSTGKSG